MSMQFKISATASAGCRRWAQLSGPAMPAAMSAAPNRRSARRCDILHLPAFIEDQSQKYNQPALYTSDDAFWERSYWDQRYEQEIHFEWYRGYQSLRPLLLRHLPRGGPVLQLGVGTSRIQADMVLMDGYQRVVSVDYSPVCIARLRELHADVAALEYAVADVRSMLQYGDCSFGGVLDKGTLDAILCGDSDTADSAAMLSECYRLLAPGAAYLVVTSAVPRSRLGYLLGNPGFPWQQVLVYEVGQQGAQAGPFDAADGEAMQALPSFKYSHFVYVCSKAEE